MTPQTGIVSETHALPVLAVRPPDGLAVRGDRVVVLVACDSGGGPPQHLIPYIADPFTSGLRRAHGFESADWTWEP